MFFEHIELRDFRSHAETILDLARINVVRGPNAAGKSSLAQAFGFLLAARSADTGENGQGAERLIRAGQKKAVIMAKLRSGAKARVTLTPKSGRDFQHKDGDWPRYSRDLLSCLCETSYFLNLPTKRQHEVIGAMVIPPDAPIEPRVLELAKSLGLTGDAPDAYTWLANLYDEAFTARRDAKRDLKQLAPVEAPDEDAFPLEEVRARLLQRRIERDRVRDARSALVVSRKTWKNASDALVLRQAELTRRELTEEQRATQLRGKLLSDGMLQKYRKAIEQEPQRKQLVTEYETVDQALNLRNAEQKALLTLDGSPTCPTCKQAVSGEYLDELVQPVATAIGELLTKRSDIQKRLQEMPAVDTAKHEVAHHTHASEELRGTEQRLAQIRADLQQIAAELRDLGPEPDAGDTATLDAELATLDESISQGERAERQSLLAEQTRAAYEAYEARRAELEQRIADLEQLVSYTAPEGVRAALAQHYMAEFVAVMASVLTRFGYGVNVEGSEWTLNMLELDRLSESERLRFGVALQVALAVASGAGFVVIDEFDLLDIASRSVLMNALMTIEALEQVIVIGTNDSTDVPAIEDVAFFYFDRQPDGTSTATQLQPAAEEEVTA